jgi:DNA-binding transcriptional ArsR family regulator
MGQVEERVREDSAIAWRCCAGLSTPALCTWRDRRHQHPGSADSEAVQSCPGWLALHTVAADASVRRANRGDHQPVRPSAATRSWGSPVQIRDGGLQHHFRLTSAGRIRIFNHMVKYSSDTLDKTFSALSDPTRRAILARLAEGDASVSELAAPFAMSLPAISKHLRVLEQAGLVERTKDGRVHRLRLVAQPLHDAAAWIAHYQRFWQQQLEVLADYLHDIHSEEGPEEHTS